jgi:hypothetical protein
MTPAGLKPGDQVKVIYVGMGDKRIIKGIGKAQCNRRGPRRAPSAVSPASFPPEAH